MNRREMLAGLVASAAAVDVAATASVIEAEPKPLLLVMRYEEPRSLKQNKYVIQSIRAFQARHPELPPIVVLEPGMTLEAVVDPREVKS